MDHIWLLPSVFSEIQPFRDQTGTGTLVVEATEFKFEVKIDL